MSPRQPDSYTVWERLEPVARNYDLTETLRAEVHDPLWALTRQWQLGEFEGHDGGSPVCVDVTYHQDVLDTVDIAGNSLPYDPSTDGPLEATVEREPVATDGPNYRLRFEAGTNFLERLRRAASDAGKQPPVPSEFADEYRLDMSDETLTADARRFEHVVATDGDTDDRALDGYAVFAAVHDHVWTANSNGTGGSFDWTNASAGDLPVPDSWSGVPGVFETAAEAYHDWYRDLYDEPESAATDAWNEDRLEYEFAVETAGDGVRTRFAAEEYTGGRLDWYDFTVTGGTDGNAGEADTGPETESVMPTRTTFRGMPNPRYWALEDSEVNFDEISAATEDVGWLTMIEIGLLAGTDWYTFPLDVPYGSLTRVTDLTVMDTFGKTTTVDAEAPVDGGSQGPRGTTGGWNAFHVALPHRQEPGVFVPPVLGPAAQSDPVERVQFTRDGMANLVFAVESLVEGPLGDPVDRAEFDRPEVVVSDVVPDDDPDAEYVEFENRGDDAVDLTGWRLVVEVADDTGSFSFDGERATGGGTVTVHTFGDVELPPRGRVRLYTGGFPTQSVADERFVGADETLWARGGALASYQLHDGSASGNSLVLEEPVGTVSEATLPQYRLATDVPDHWFPLKADPKSADEYVLEVALLLDADTLADTVDAVPRPLGEILTNDARIHEEEVTELGTEVTRRYQLASGRDGRVHLWSGRNVDVGGAEESSGLRFDFLEEPDA